MNKVLCEYNDHVAVITLNDPLKMNMISKELVDELEMVVEQVSVNQDVSVVLLRGAGGKAFSAGGDINFFTSLKGSLDAYEFGQRGHKLLRKFEELDKPIIAVVDGYCFAGGLELALACDFIVCSDRSLFALAESGIGIIPGWGGTVRLPKSMPIRKARELLYTASTLDATDALKFGLVNHVFTVSELEEKVHSIAASISSKPKQVVKLLKETVNKSIEVNLESGLAIETGAFATLFNTDDKNEGVTAFLEKRSPNFSNR